MRVLTVPISDAELERLQKLAQATGTAELAALCQELLDLRALRDAVKCYLYSPDGGGPVAHAVNCCSTSHELNPCNCGLDAMSEACR